MSVRRTADTTTDTPTGHPPAARQTLRTSNNEKHLRRTPRQRHRHSGQVTTPLPTTLCAHHSLPAVTVRLATGQAASPATTDPPPTSPDAPPVPMQQHTESCVTPDLARLPASDFQLAGSWPMRPAADEPCCQTQMQARLRQLRLHCPATTPHRHSQADYLRRLTPTTLGISDHIWIKFALDRSNCQKLSYERVQVHYICYLS